MFVRNRLYAPLEDGSDGGGGDGGAPPDDADLVPAGGPESGAGGGDTTEPEKGAEKASMLDAIKASLGGGGDQAPKPPAADAGAPKSPAEKAPVKPEDKYATPKDLSPNGQARFKELVGEIKSKDEELGRLSERVKVADGFLEAARGVGAGPEEFGLFFEFMGNLRNHPEQAIKFLENQISLIAREYGLAAGGNEDNLLARHPDLQQEVETYRITKERALELAQIREQGQRRTQVDQQIASQTEMQERARKVEDDSIAAITKWATELQTKDIDWPQKKEVLFGQLAQLVDGVSPELWLKKIQAAYQLMGPIKAPPPRAAEVKGRQPLRASTGSGAPQAGSMMEAIKSGLESMRAG